MLRRAFASVGRFYREPVVVTRGRVVVGALLLGLLLALMVVALDPDLKLKPIPFFGGWQPVVAPALLGGGDASGPGGNPNNPPGLAGPSGAVPGGSSSNALAGFAPGNPGHEPPEFALALFALGA
jgi:hypothetical protein